MINGIDSALKIASVGEKESSGPRLNTDKPSQDFDAVSVQFEERGNSGAALDISLEKNSAEIASEAAKDIYEIRQEQLELAKEADNSSDPSARTRIQTEIESLQSEIERIATSAVDQNGNSVLSSSGVTLSNNETLQRADISSISDNPNIDLSSETSTAAAVETLTETASTAFQLSETAEASFNRAERILTEEVSVQQERRLTEQEALTNVEEAAQLAQDVSDQIVRQFSDQPNPARALTETLTSRDPSTEALSA